MKVSSKQFSFIAVETSLVFLISLLLNSVKAQVLVLDPVDRVIMPKEHVNLKGSPYLYDDWVKGMVKLANGVEYRDIYLMYDQVKDELHFTYEDGKAQLFVDPVASFVIGDKEFRKDVVARSRPLPKEFYEVLVEGEVLLLRRTIKRMIEELNHGVATKNVSIQSTVGHYISVGGRVIRVKSSIRHFLQDLEKHKEEISRFAMANKLNLKTEQDLIKLITYYNSLN